MGIFIGVVRVNEGLVLFSDILSDPSNEINIIKISENAAALLVDDLDTGRLFLEAHILDFAKENPSFDAIVKEAIRVIQIQPSPFKNKVITVVLVGHGPHLQDKPFIVLKFNGVEADIKAVHEDVLFSINDQLGKYLASKVYSKLMSLQSCCLFAAYVTAQYSLIFRGMVGKHIRIATISLEGFQELDQNIIKTTTTDVRKIDIKIRRACCDLFLPIGDETE